MRVNVARPVEQSGTVNNGRLGDCFELFVEGSLKFTVKTSAIDSGL